MHAHDQPAQQRRQAALGIVLTLALGGFAWWGGWMDAASFDIPLVLRASEAVTNVVMVSIDEESYRRLVSFDADANKILDRRHHLSLLNRLEEAGAKAVVFDYIFQSHWREESVDDALGRAMRRMSNVVLAAILDYDDQNQKLRIAKETCPIAALRTNAQMGFAEAEIDPDQVVRRHFSDERRMSLAWAAAAMLGKTPGTLGQPRWIHYYGQPNAIETIPYYQALDPTAFPPALLAQKVAGKTVFIGEGREGKTSDWHMTPHTKYWGRSASGVEIQATMFLNLWRGDWLRRLPSWVELAVLAAAALVLGGSLAYLRPRPALGWALGAAVLVFAGAVVLAWETRWWFSWLTVCAVQTPVALAWSVFSHAARLRPVPDPAPNDATRLGSETDGPAVPVIPDHSVLSCVGRGGYGEVWLTRNFLGDFYAAKIVRRGRFEAREPYERELRGVKRFMPISRGHSGWVPILHVGQNEAQACFYYVMEAADDETSGATIDPASYRPLTLSRTIELRGPMALSQCVDLGLRLAAALEYLHGHGLVHRDIKTSNIVYLRGAPRFVDIGLVTEMAAPGRDASFVGSHDYMPPEGPGAPGADVYALGKVLYAALTGLAPSHYPDLPTSQAEAAHESGLLELFNVVAKACEEDRRRFQTAQELHDALRRLKV